MYDISFFTIRQHRVLVNAMVLSAHNVRQRNSRTLNVSPASLFAPYALVSKASFEPLSLSPLSSSHAVRAASAVTS